MEKYSFNTRKKYIINKIVNSKNEIKGLALAKDMNLSIRTIQNEIASINKEIPIILSSNKGYTIDKNLISTIVITTTDDFDLNHQLLKEIFFNKGNIRFDNLADLLFISTSTLDNKIKESNVELKQFNLKILRQDGLLKIQGTELNKRRFISNLILNEVDPTFNNIDNLSSFFKEMDIPKTKSIIINAIHKNNFFVENNYSSNLLINIILALYRMRLESYIESNPETIIDSNSNEYKIALEICNQYANHWNISPQKNDILYVATLIVGQIKPIELQNNDSHLFDIISRNFIEEIDNILLDTFTYFMLDVNYQQFLYNFALHIDGLIKRASSNQFVNNEVLDNLKKNCPFVYEVAIVISEKISSKYNIVISDDEIGYISIHIGFLIENSVEDTNEIKVLLVTKDYHQISNNIIKKLNEIHGDYINIQSINDPNSEKNIDFTADLIISTNKINIIGKKVVTVTPFFSLMDQLEVDNAIRLCIKEKELNNRNKLLSSFFNEKLFFKISKIDNRDEAIRFLSKKVINFGLVDSDFTDSVFKRESLSSTSFFETFAIPHAIEMNAKKTMFAVLLNEEGIKWGDNSVKIVLMIAVQKNDRRKFMDIYNSIVQILWDKEKAEHLLQANTLEDFILLLKKSN